MHWLGKVDESLQAKCATHIRRRQLADGGWNIFIGGPSEINASVKAYFALKLAGDSPNAAWMREARANVLRLGGIPQINTYGKLYLALLGQFPWQYLPTDPAGDLSLPEMVLLQPVRDVVVEPHDYRAAHDSQSLQTDTPASVRHAAPRAVSRRARKYRSLTQEASALLGLAELLSCVATSSSSSTTNSRFIRLRQRALKAAETWMVERMGEGSDGLGAIFPAMLNAMMALRVLGYPDDHPLVKKADQDFAGFFVDDGDDFRIQPCLSPVWDTAITTIALAESGLPEESSGSGEVRRLVGKKGSALQGRLGVHVSGVEPSGWAFEHENKYYPDTDDTMMVLMALRHVAPSDSGEASRAEPTAPWPGYSPSSARMAAGRPSTRTSPRAGWSTCRSPITTPSSIRPAPI